MIRALYEADSYKLETTVSHLGSSFGIGVLVEVWTSQAWCTYIIFFRAPRSSAHSLVARRFYLLYAGGWRLCCVGGTHLRLLEGVGQDGKEPCLINIESLKCPVPYCSLSFPFQILLIFLHSTDRSPPSGSHLEIS